MALENLREVASIRITNAKGNLANWNGCLLEQPYRLLNTIFGQVFDKGLIISCAKIS